MKSELLWTLGWCLALIACQSPPELPPPQNRSPITSPSDSMSDATSSSSAQRDVIRGVGGAQGGSSEMSSGVMNEGAPPADPRSRPDLGSEELDEDVSGGISVIPEGGQMMLEADQGTREGGQMTPEHTSVALPESCQGPLELPLPDCRPAPLPSTGDLYRDCVRRVNQLRAICQCLPPLERWYEGESCADTHAEYDAMTGQAHSGFREQICSPQGRGQNECPGYRSEDQVISLCLQQMWDEGPGEPFIEHGHYINMTNPSHQRVACGFFMTAEGRVWAIQNFSP